MACLNMPRVKSIELRCLIPQLFAFCQGRPFNFCRLLKTCMVKISIEARNFRWLQDIGYIILCQFIPNTRHISRFFISSLSNNVNTHGCPLLKSHKPCRTGLVHGVLLWWILFYSLTKEGEFILGSLVKPEILSNIYIKVYEATGLNSLHWLIHFKNVFT